jgi:hypothetical protein
MNILQRSWNAIRREIRELHERNRCQDEEVRQAILDARYESIRMTLAVQSRKWK